MRAGRKKLGEILVKEGLITEYQLAQARGHQKEWGGTLKLGSELIRRGFIDEDDLCAALERQLKIKWISLHDVHISHEVVGSVSKEMAKKWRIMPVAADKTSVTIATSDPSDLKSLDTIGFQLGKRIKAVIATSADLNWAIAKYYEGITHQAPPIHKKRPDTEADGATEAVRGDGTPPIALRALVQLLVEGGVIDEDDFVARIIELKKKMAAEK